MGLQVTPASSEWVQVVGIDDLQSTSLLSAPLQSKSDKKMEPLPWPKNAAFRAIAPVPE